MQSITMSINDATKALGIGRTTLYSLIAQGRVEVVKLGRRTLVKTDSLRRLVEAD